MEEDTNGGTQDDGRRAQPPSMSERIELTGVAPPIGIDLLRATTILGGARLSDRGVGMARWRR